MPESARASETPETSRTSDEADERDEPDEELPTPDRLLHTGAEHPIDPEDLVRLSGREPTPERVARARRELEEEGAAAVERHLP